jgi:hypothetical protein
MSGINDKIKQLISDRLDHGQKIYGQDLPLEDDRDLVLESLEEILDAMVYTAGQIIRLMESRNAEK